MRYAVMTHSGEVIRVGQVIMDFRSELWRFQSIVEPPRLDEGAVGKIKVIHPTTREERIFYCSNFGLHIESSGE